MALRSLRSGLEPGEPVVVGGAALASIDVTDERFFRIDNLSAWSIKFIYSVF